MKLTTAAAALLIVSTVAFGADSDKDKKAKSSKVTVVQNTQQKFKLVYLEQNQGKVKVNIKNSDGVIVYHQSVNNEDGFSQSYSFEKLPEGTYTFEITRPDGTRLTQEVEHRMTMAQPEIKANLLDINDNKKFRLAVVKYNTKPVKVNIFNESDELVHSETINSRESFRKIYDLSELEGSSFRFDLTNNASTISMSAE